VIKTSNQWFNFRWVNLNVEAEEIYKKVTWLLKSQQLYNKGLNDSKVDEISNNELIRMIKSDQLN
jgi:hypothetical protein